MCIENQEFRYNTNFYWYLILEENLENETLTCERRIVKKLSYGEAEDKMCIKGASHIKVYEVFA